ncbi:MAG: CPBP family intramembrane metalloprotease [Planctomycetota bacterium]|nr:MAG: CPBP family intramembrane metalloprotease [Planctomycetota bacterium]
MHHLRVFAAGIVIAATMLAIFPLLPWSHTVQGWQVAAGWPLVNLLSAMGFIAAACLLPAQPQQPNRTWPPAQAGMLGLAALCLIEPLVQLAILAWAGWRPPPGIGDLLLPAALTPYDMGTWLRLIVLWVLLPAIAEEWFFRGRLQPWLQRYLGTFSAISLTTLWFAALHGHVLAMLVALPIGLLLGLLRHYTGSVYACILVHGVHNVLLVALGGLFIARPDIAGLLILVGLALLMLFWQWTQRPRLLASCAVLSVGLMLAAGYHGLYRSAQEPLWSHAMRRIMASMIPPAVDVVQRLEVAQQHGVITPGRAQRLAARLRAQPLSEPSTQYWSLAVLDRQGLLAAYAGKDHYPLLRHLASHPEGSPALSDAALLTAAAQPHALSAIAQEDPRSLPLLLPLPEYRQQWLALLASMDLRHRLSTLSAIRLAWDADTAAQLHLDLPLSSIGPRDRVHLMRSHPRGRQLIDALQEQDPDRFRAWTGQEPSPEGL